MLVKINGNYVYIYKDSDSYYNLTKFRLKGILEPDECYLAINEDLHYYISYG